MPIIKGKGTFLTLISGLYSGAFFTGGTNDVWVQSLSFGPKWTSETQNSFGSNDPVEVDDTYDGIKASFDLIETASKLCLSVLTRQVAATAVGFDPSLYNECTLFANFKNTKWKTGDLNVDKWIGSVFLDGLKVVAADTNSAVDGVSTKKFDFEGTSQIEFNIPMHLESLDGDNSTTAFDLTPPDNGAGATAYDGNFIQRCWVDGVLQVKGTDYTETDLDTVTFSSAPPTGTGNIQILYAYTPVNV